jgi:hypothetical protein
MAISRPPTKPAGGFLFPTFRSSLPACLTVTEELPVYTSWSLSDDTQ